MAKPSFHIHLDAAFLPVGLMDRMVLEGGFYLDDSPHELKVDGVCVPARHLTKYLYPPTNSKIARAECHRLKSWAQEFSFKGLIQCEYVMEETEWTREEEQNKEVPVPFKIIPRSLTNKKGDQFKKHEVHLELSKKSTSENVINALRQCGFHILENSEFITFTASGHSRQMLDLRKALKIFLKEHKIEITGKLTYEATAFWSLHDVESENLPVIIDRLMIR